MSDGSFSSSSSSSGSSSISSSSADSASSLVCVFEFVFHVSDLKNIDLFRQGLYYIRSQFYTTHTVNSVKHKHVIAMPYHLISPSSTTASSSSSSSPSTDHGLSALDRCVYPAYISDDEHFCSRTFRIQYCEQVATLNDACLFRLELNARKRVPIFLDVDLMFAEYTAQDVVRNRDPPPPASFDRVSTKSYQLTSCYTGGVHSYLPVTFDENHFCLLQSMVHSMMMEFRFKLPKRSHHHHNHHHSSSTSASASPSSSSSSSSSSALLTSISVSHPELSSPSSSASTPPINIPPPVPPRRSSPPRSSSSLNSSLSSPPLSSSASAFSTSSLPTHSPLTLPATPTRPELPPSPPPFAFILFPRLAAYYPHLASSSLASSSSASPSLPASPYTAQELSSLADRYHHFFVSNLMRAYNSLAIAFDTYLRHTLSDSSNNRMKIKPLQLPDDAVWHDLHFAQHNGRAQQHDKQNGSSDQAVTREEQSGEEKKSEREEDTGRYLRPTAIDTVHTTHLSTPTIKPSGSPTSPSVLPSSSPFQVTPPATTTTLSTSTHVAASSSSSSSSSSSASSSGHLSAGVPSATSLSYRSFTPPPPSSPSVSRIPLSHSHSIPAPEDSVHRAPAHSVDTRSEEELAYERTERVEHEKLRRKFHAIRLQPLSVRLKPHLTYESVARTILADLQSISQQSFHLWNTLINLLPLLTHSLFPYVRSRWNALCLDEWSSFVFRESYEPQQRFKLADSCIIDAHQQVAQVARKNAHQIILPLPIVEVETIPSALLADAKAAAAGSSAAAGTSSGTSSSGGGSTVDRSMSSMNGLGDYPNQVVVFEEAYVPGKAAHDTDESTSQSHLEPFDDHSDTEESHSEAQEADRDTEPSLSYSSSSSFSSHHHHHLHDQPDHDSHTIVDGQLVRHRGSPDSNAMDGDASAALGVQACNPREIEELDVSEEETADVGLDSRPRPRTLSLHNDPNHAPPSPATLTAVLNSSANAPPCIATCTTTTTAATVPAQSSASAPPALSNSIPPRPAWSVDQISTALPSASSSSTSSSSASASSSSPSPAPAASSTTPQPHSRSLSMHSSQPHSSSSHSPTKPPNKSPCKSPTKAAHSSTAAPSSFSSSSTSSSSASAVLSAPSTTQPATSSSSAAHSSSFSSSSSYSQGQSSFPRVKLHTHAGKHVFILCHGYQGSSWDMRLFKNQLHLIVPDALCFLSSANENQTEGDIHAMGERLAHEVVHIIETNCTANLGRLSFIAHSLGGLIVRAALTQPILAPYLPYLYTYLSLASPHLGYIYAENPWLTTGLWLLKKWNKSLCLSQLSLSDHDDLTQSYLYTLSQHSGLRWFEHVLLCASQQDKYVPFHSARIEMCTEAVNDLRRGQAYHTMVQRLLAGLGQHVAFKRFDLLFVNRKKSLDTLIGRAAHIYFLDHQPYMHLFIHVYKHYFV